MTREQLLAIAEKIRSADPETRRKGLVALRDVLSLAVSMIDALLKKEDQGNAEKKDEST